jgi:hypothetical protein
MLRKFGFLTMGLLVCLVAAPYNVRAQDDNADEAAISDLEKFAQPGRRYTSATVNDMLQRARRLLEQEKPYEAELLVDELLQAEEVDRDDKQQAAVLNDRIQAAKTEVTEEAETALRAIELKTRRNQLEAQRLATMANEALQNYELEQARKLARRALLLDPTNELANRVQTVAGTFEGDPVATARYEEDIQRLAHQKAMVVNMMNMETSLDRAREAFAEGDFDTALAEYRRALSYASVLDVYRDMDERKQAIKEMIDEVRREKQAQEAQETETARARTEELQAKKQRMLEQVMDEARAERIDELFEKLDQGSYDEAERILNDLQMEDPTDDIVNEFRTMLFQKKFDHRIRRINQDREAGKYSEKLRMAAREIVPPRLFNYNSDKGWWVNVVEKRAPTGYPSERARRLASEEDRRVYERMDDTVDLPFNGQPLPEAIRYLDDLIDGVDFILVGDGLEARTVTLEVDEITLEKALKLVTEDTDTAWKVEDGLIKVGTKGAIREYEMRIYAIHDMLVSFGDAGDDDDDDDDDDETMTTTTTTRQ